MTLKQTLTTLPQYILPHHGLSRLMSKLTHCRNPLFKNLFIKLIVQLYGVNMAEAKSQNLDDYASFNDFFTRELKAGVRPIDSAKNSIVSPADGKVSQAGKIHADRLIQAKGMDFSAIDLLGGQPETARPYQDGQFATIYLSPKDYHRLHMPLSGTLKEMIHIPGRLFSVNETTANSVPGLFARNERVVCLFDTEAGEMALVLVGAIFVSSVETVWHGVVTPPTATAVQRWQYKDEKISLKKGEEMGRFNMGSTIIVLFEKDKIQWEKDFVAGKNVQLGEKIGQIITA